MQAQNDVLREDKDALQLENERLHEQLRAQQLAPDDGDKGEAGSSHQASRGEGAPSDSSTCYSPPHDDDTLPDEGDDVSNAVHIWLCSTDAH